MNEENNSHSNDHNNNFDESSSKSVDLGEFEIYKVMDGVMENGQKELVICHIGDDPGKPNVIASFGPVTKGDKDYERREALCLLMTYYLNFAFASGFHYAKGSYLSCANGKPAEYIKSLFYKSLWEYNKE